MQGCFRGNDKVWCAGMRRIDLTCLIASPIMAGLLLTYGNLQIAILAIMVTLQTLYVVVFNSPRLFHSPNHVP